MYKIRVPASTANFGVGFDCIGMALDLILEVHIEAIEHNDKSENIIREVIWQDPNTSEIPIHHNFVAKSLTQTLNFIDKNYKKLNNSKTGLNINVNQLGYKLYIISAPIPSSRGLGSSSAAIVAGILCAFAITKTPIDIEQIIQLATEIEGHPDNVVPAILGGIQISLIDNNKVYTTSVPIPETLGFIVLIPPFKMNTANSRDILPSTYTKKDCINNLSRFGFMISSLFQNKNLELLSTIFDDRLHQPYRLKLINGAEQIIEYAATIGAFGGFLSGSGSSIMICYDKNDTEFYNKITDYINSYNKYYKGWESKKLSPYKNIVQIEEASI